MNQWKMIKVEYIRIPKSVVYNAVVQVMEIIADIDVEETMIEDHSLQTVSMEDIIRVLHKKLQQYPDATVTMGPRSKKTQLTEFKEDLRNLIRDNLPEALERFAPIHRTIHVRDKETRDER